MNIRNRKWQQLSKISIIVEQTQIAFEYTIIIIIIIICNGTNRLSWNKLGKLL